MELHAGAIIAVVVLMILSAVVGRWSALRHHKGEAVNDAEPWVVVSEAASSAQETPSREGSSAAQAKPQSDPRATPQENNTTSPLVGCERSKAQRGPVSVKELGSQAPCTYTTVRGHATGRFLPLPSHAHG